MSFFATSYKPQAQVRQEGFHLPDPSSASTPSANSTGNNSGGNPVQNNPSSSSTAFDYNMHHPVAAFLPDAFRRSAGEGTSSMDFTDELVSLMGHAGPHPGAGGPTDPPSHNPHATGAGHHHQGSNHERSTHSPPTNPSNGPGSAAGPGPGAYDEYGRPSTHSVFDMAASSNPSQPHSHSHNSSSSFPAHFTLHHRQQQPQPTGGDGQPPPQSVVDFTTQQQQQQQHAAHFSPISPLSRYDSIAHGAGQQAHHDAQNVPPPTSFSPSSFRHTPSPHMHPAPANPGNSSRSRSRPRAPSAGPGPGLGPTRTTTTTRSRRNNSVSSVSPPPLPRPGIVIPHRNGHMNGHGHGLSIHSLGSGAAPPGGWFMQGQDYLPPDPLHPHTHPLHISHHPQPFSPFGLSVSPDAAASAGGAGAGGPLSSSLSSLHSQHTHTPSSSLHGPHALDADTSDASAKQAMLANEKRRRRRESHNAVERRRRDNINEKISELATLIPECMLDAGPPASTPITPDNDPMLATILSPVQSPIVKDEKEDGAPSSVVSAASGAGAQQGQESGVVKANKGMILRKSVEYIRYLQQLVTAQATRNRELESQLIQYRDDSCLSTSSLLPGVGGQSHGSSGSSGLTEKGPSPLSHHSHGLGHPHRHRGGAGEDDVHHMLLHDDASGFNFSALAAAASFGVVGGELASMREDVEPEEDDLMLDGDGGDGKLLGLSPSVGSEESVGVVGAGTTGAGAGVVEEERGRRDRNGRFRGTGLSAGIGGGAEEGTKAMETS